MRTGIIGFPLCGKTSLFTILTRIAVAPGKGDRETRLGVVKVPDSRLARLAELYQPNKVVYAALEYADMPPASEENLKEASYLATLRQLDALAHVVRVFSNPAVPHPDPIDPGRDIGKMEFDFILNDLEQIEKRLERLEKERKIAKKPEQEREEEILRKTKAHLETERPLRELAMTKEEKKRIRGFMFLSEKPLILVLNVGEGEITDIQALAEKYGLRKFFSQPGVAAAAVCAKMEAELAELDEQEAAGFLKSYGFQESALDQLIRKTYQLFGFLSFFTVGKDECRVWTIRQGMPAVEAAGTIHSDLAKHFIRAETIRWDELLEAGSEANAKAKGKFRLEGKEYLVQDGDILHVRHSA